MKLSLHFSLEEFTHSDTAIRKGIDQTPSPDVLKNLTNTAMHMETVRRMLGGHPIRISSGYRSPALNRVIGGARNSAHVMGQAVDFTCPDFGGAKKVAKFLQSSDLAFDQLIYEGTWVHIAFTSAPRRQVLTAHFGPSTTYTEGIA